MNQLIQQLLLASAVAINVITWIIELEKRRILTLIADISITLIIVKLAGGSALVNSAILYASLIISYKLNRTDSSTRAMDRKIFRAN